MRAIVAQVLNNGTLSDPKKLYSFLHAVTGTMAVDEGFTIDEMQSLALGMRGVRSKNIKFMTVPAIGASASEDGQSIVELDPDRDGPLFEAFRNRYRRGLFGGQSRCCRAFAGDGELM